MTGYRFKLGMWMPELALPFEQSLATAKDIGAEYVWFNRLERPEEIPIAALSDAEIDRMGAQVAGHGLKLHMISAGNPFKQVHLADLDLATMQDHPEFRHDFDALVRSMQIAVQLGVGAVCAHTFAWPGEYTAAKPTWPMRWLTRGGVISDAEMDKLTKAYSLAAEQAERYGVDVVLTQEPWNYTSTTGNFRRIAERVGSPRIKLMWTPSDNVNSGEWDAVTAGFANGRPYLHGLHMKDLHIFDGQQINFEYRPIGTGDVDYLTVLRQLRDHRCDVILGVATHFVPASGSRVEAMRLNYANVKALIARVEAGE